jgi:hypothetical protein
MREFHFRLAIPPAEYLSYYQGAARNVVTKSVEGLVVQFPANVLRDYVTAEGVFGRFVLRVDANNKFHSLERLGD